MTHTETVQTTLWPTYPDRPAARPTDTSREAAEALEERAPVLRARALAIIQRRPSTADEVAEMMGCTVLTIRPRVAELHRQGLVEDSGQRRRNVSGKKAIVWRAGIVR